MRKEITTIRTTAGGTCREDDCSDRAEYDVVVSEYDEYHPEIPVRYQEGAVCSGHAEELHG